MAACLSGAVHGQPAPDVVQRLERQLRQVDEEYRLTIPPGQPIAERLLLDYGGTFRFGFYSIDGPTGSSHFLRLYDLRLYLRAELDGAHRFFGRLRFLYEDWNSGDSFDGRGDELANPIGERYWYEFDLRGAVLAARGEHLPYNVNLRAGKQFVEWGSGLTFSDALYAGLLDIEAYDFGVIGLAGATPAHDTIDFDGSRPDFDTNTQRAYAGAALEYRATPTHRPYAFFLVQRDNNSEDFMVFDGPLGPIPTSFNYDSYYVGLGSRGTLASNLRYRAELVYEFGEGLSNSFDTTTGLGIPQTEEDIDAWAGRQPHGHEGPLVQHPGVRGHRAGPRPEPLEPARAAARGQHVSLPHDEEPGATPYRRRGLPVLQDRLRRRAEHPEQRRHLPRW
jgi:hypothetical protein